MGQEKMIKKGIDFILELKALGYKNIPTSEVATHFDISNEKASDLLRDIMERKTFPTAKFEHEPGTEFNEIRFP